MYRQGAAIGDDGGLEFSVINFELMISKFTVPDSFIFQKFQNFSSKMEEILKLNFTKKNVFKPLSRKQFSNCLSEKLSFWIGTYKSSPQK
jgi:hypothetical protein